jgi:hypothetical protein
LFQRIKVVASVKKGKKNGYHSDFYGKYAIVVFRCLRNPVFLKFVKWVLKREEIENERVKNVQIRMFPSVKENGNSLIGKCNAQGEVFLYPKQFDVCKKKFCEMKPERFTKYVEGRARASLIHELLHLKYEDDEKRVKQLTKKYFTIFHKNKCSEQSNLSKLKGLIFNY